MTNLMTRTRLILIGLIIVMGVSFLGGYLPERGRRLAAETELGVANTRLSALGARDRLCALLGILLQVQDLVSAQNLYDAAAGSTRLFDGLRAEASQTVDPNVRGSLESILTRRDEVTGALARGDSNASGLLRSIQLDLRRILGLAV